MDVSTDEYHSANDESFANSAHAVSPTRSAQLTPTATLAARKQLAPTSTNANEPAKPLSAYGLFFRDTVSAIKQQNPNCTFQELSRIVLSMWEALDASHKIVYSKKHEAATTEYIKQMRIYQQQQEEQQQKQQQQLQQQQLTTSVTAASTPALQTKPAVFTISRFNADTNNSGANYNNVATSNEIVANVLQPQMQAQTASQDASNTTSSTNSTTTTANDPTQPQIQMLSEAGAVQKCTRENCNKRAIINPDWEDEYCSNECVVIHCRNVFNAWVQSNLESRKQ